MFVGKVKVLIVLVPLSFRNVAGMFSKEDFDVLAPAVDAFSLMTYDYSNPSR